MLGHKLRDDSHAIHEIPEQMLALEEKFDHSQFYTFGFARNAWLGWHSLFRTEYARISLASRNKVKPIIILLLNIKRNLAWFCIGQNKKMSRIRLNMSSVPKRNVQITTIVLWLQKQDKIKQKITVIIANKIVATICTDLWVNIE